MASRHARIGEACTEMDKQSRNRRRDGRSEVELSYPSANSSCPCTGASVTSVALTPPQFGSSGRWIISVRDLLVDPARFFYPAPAPFFTFDLLFMDSVPSCLSMEVSVCVSGAQISGISYPVKRPAMSLLNGTSSRRMLGGYTTLRRCLHVGACARSVQLSGQVPRSLTRLSHDTLAIPRNRRQPK